LVSYSSVITMMHGPINIRFELTRFAVKQIHVTARKQSSSGKD